MKIERFEDIEAWKVARELTMNIYRMTRKSPLSKDYGLRDQMQSASISIMANIAEGFDSGSKKSFTNFLRYAFRSSSEVQSLLYIAMDCNYIQKEDFNKSFLLTQKTKALIGGFIRYLRADKVQN